MINDLSALRITSRLPAVAEAQMRGLRWLRSEETGLVSGCDTRTLFGAADLADFRRLTPHFLKHLDDVIHAELRSTWPRHAFRSVDLAATLYRLAFGYVNAPDEPPADSSRAHDRDNGSIRTHQVTELARVAPNMHHAPHALLTFRCSGLVYSKRDQYTSAWLSFAEGRRRVAHFHRAVQGEDSEDLERMRAEVRERLLLGETGTASRAVERTLQDWYANPVLGSERARRLSYHHAYDVLLRGTSTGRLSNEEIEHLEKRSEDEQDQTHIATLESTRRPAVMTGRCHLELIPLCRIVESFGTKHPTTDSWDSDVEYHKAMFINFYRRASDDLASGVRERFHERELVQLRLHFALLFPDDRLPAAPAMSNQVDQILTSEELDRDEMADWLDRGGHDANVVASITSPEYLAWMQRISKAEDTIDWLLDVRLDSLRRPSARRLVRAHRSSIADAVSAYLETLGGD